MYINSSMIGNIGEASAIYQFSSRNIPVSIPFGQNVPYDMIIQLQNKLYRIQCKTSEHVYDDKMTFYISRTNGFKAIHTKYTINDIDFLYLHCIENGYNGLINISEVTTSTELHLRLKPPRNNQLVKVRYAKDYEIDVQLNKLIHNNMIKPFTIVI